MAQFSNFRQNSMADEKKKKNVMIEGQYAETAVEWAKCFHARRTWQKLSFHLRNYVQSSRTWHVLEQLMKFRLIFYGLNGQERWIESTIKNYHPKNCLHSKLWLQYACTSAKKCRKIQENEKYNISSTNHKMLIQCFSYGRIGILLLA